MSITTMLKGMFIQSYYHWNHWIELHFRRALGAYISWVHTSHTFPNLNFKEWFAVWWMSKFRLQLMNEQELLNVGDMLSRLSLTQETGIHILESVFSNETLLFETRVRATRLLFVLGRRHRRAVACFVWGTTQTPYDVEAEFNVRGQITREEICRVLCVLGNPELANLISKEGHAQAQIIRALAAVFSK